MKRGPGIRVSYDVAQHFAFHGGIESLIAFLDQTIDLPRETTDSPRYSTGARLRQTGVYGPSGLVRLSQILSESGTHGNLVPSFRLGHASAR